MQCNSSCTTFDPNFKILAQVVPENYLMEQAHNLLTLCIPMDFPIQIHAIRIGLSIVYFMGSQVEILK